MESTGAKLKRIRLEKGLSLEQVHKATKVHLNILKAIEEDNLVNFNPVYIKGFIKIYCKSLGISPRDCIPDYKEEARIVKPAATGPSMPPTFALDLSAARIKPLLNAAFPYLKKGLIVLAVLILAVGIKNFIFRPGKQKEKVKAQKPAVVKTELKPSAVDYPIAASSGIRLVILAKDADCWIKLKSDGKVVFQNTLKKGRSESWQAKDRIELSLSNARAIELQINEKVISNLSRKGKALKNIVITKDGLTVP